MSVPRGSACCRAVMGDDLSAMTITQSEAAERLSVSRWTIWRLLRDGELEAVRIRGKTLVSTRSVEGLIERSVATAAAMGVR